MCSFIQYETFPFYVSIELENKNIKLNNRKKLYFKMILLKCIGTIDFSTKKRVQELCLYSDHIMHMTENVLAIILCFLYETSLKL